MSTFNLIEIKDKTSHLDLIVNHFKLKTVSDQDIWEVAKSFKSVPRFMDIYYMLTYDRIKFGLEQNYKNIYFEIWIENFDNTWDLIIDGEVIRTLGELLTIINKKKGEKE